MAARASTCLVLGLLLTGCPFALDDDYFIDEDVASVPTVPAVAPAPPVPAPMPAPHPMPNDAAPPPDGADCTRKTPCLLGYECRGKDCEKTP